MSSSQGDRSGEEIPAARAMRLATGIVGPFYSMSRRVVVGFAVAVVIGFIAGILTGKPAVGAIVGATLCLVAATIAWWPLFDPTVRDATELYYDHDCHERAEWKAEMGTTMPRGTRAIKHWLLAHPTSPGRASLLLALGRLDEADIAIDAIQPSSPEEAFSVQILRETRNLYAGGQMDLAPLHASWRSLPDPRERRHRRECLAILDAALAVDAGWDPIPALAAGRLDVGEVHRTMRVPWLVAKWSSLAVVGVAAATLVTIVVTT